MKPRKLIAPLTIFFIFLSGFFLQTINFLEEKEGGASASEYMGAKVTIHPKMIIPYDKEDAAYTAHAGEIAALFKEKGYAVETRPYDTLMFRSLVHSGRFDLVLLEKRTST